MPVLEIIGGTILLVSCLAIVFFVSIQTEKKLKTKQITFAPPVAGKLAKQRRMVFGGNGRRFRIILESSAADMWKLIGGIQIEAETDID